MRAGPAWSATDRSPSPHVDRAGGAAGSRDPGRLLAGRYRLGPVLGCGATSTVHLAQDVLLERQVAVKLFADHATEGDRSGPESEAMIAALLHHPGLTTLLDVGVDSSSPTVSQSYLVLDHEEGADLNELLLDHGAMLPAEVCWLGTDLAGALDHLHELGFLHRDVKPANILIGSRGRGARRRVRLTDFGIAAPIGRTESVDHVMGTAAYLSPEQAQGQDASTASDVYALGLVLLEALTGVRAFPGPDSGSTFARIARDPVVPCWIPAEIAAVIRSMTNRIAEQRSSMGEVADRLRLLAAEHEDGRVAAPDEAPAEKLEQELADRLLDESRPWMPQPSPDLEFLVFELGDDAGVVGAAVLARAETNAGRA